MPKTRRISAAELTRMWSDPRIRTEDIGRHFGVSRNAVSLWAIMLGLPSRRNNRYVSLAPQDYDTFRSMWRAGVMAEDMAEHFGCHRKTIRNMSVLLGEQPRPVGGRYPRITIEQWRQDQLRTRMRAQAEADRAQWRNAEMVDGKSGNWAVAAR